MSKDLYEAIEDRRSIYGLSKETTIDDNLILEIVEHAVKFAPSPMNCQSARVVVLFTENHDLLWDIVKESLRKRVSAERFAATDEKITSFYNGYATILFYEDMETVESLQTRFPRYKDTFPLWSLQSSAMLQYAIWTSLESEGLGVSLQHYNEVIEAEVKKEWDIPAKWKLISQMPFGKPTAPPSEKEFMPLPERIKVYR